jgi:hypothetical protein
VPADPYAAEGDPRSATAVIDAGSSAARDTARPTAALRKLVADADMRLRLHDEVTLFLAKLSPPQPGIRTTLIDFPELGSRAGR